MYQFIYPANVEKDEGGFYFVTFPDIERAATDGESLEEALEEAKDCLLEAIAFRITQNMDIPYASELKKGQYPVALSPLMAAKTALYITLKESGLNKSSLAKKLGIDEKEVRRMLSPKHQTKVSRIDEVLNALGKKLVISIADAA